MDCGDEAGVTPPDTPSRSLLVAVAGPLEYGPIVGRQAERRELGELREKRERLGVGRNWFAADVAKPPGNAVAPPEMMRATLGRADHTGFIVNDATRTTHFCVGMP